MPPIQGGRYSYAKFRPEDAEGLRLLVNAWMKADRDFRKLMLAKKDAERFRQQAQSMRAFFSVDDGDGRLIPWIDDTSIHPFDVAVAFFLRIATDLAAWRLDGPCSNPNCGKYFLQKTRRLKKYCRHCRRSESGPRMKAAREKKHKMLISVAREVSARCPRGCKDWKTWMVKTINQRIFPMGLDPVTRSSLTRWVRNGELLWPLERGQGDLPIR